MKIYIDGVACLGKTSFLLETQEKYGKDTVKLTDFYQFQEIIKLPKELVDSGYNCWFRQQTNEDESKTLIIDRSTYSNFIYSMIFKNIPLEDGRKYLQQLKESSQDSSNETSHEKLDVILFIVPKPGQEEMVLELMIKRNNGIDVLSLDYISSQINFFKMAAEVLDMPIFEIDVTNFSKSYKEIKKYVYNFLDLK